MSWTDERVEQLKKLWADGLSASQIAAELGGITRNAVIGKVHRLGLSGRAKAPSSAGPRPRKTRAPSHVFRSIRNALRGNTALAAHAVAAYEAEIEPEPVPLENVIPIGQRCSILELKHRLGVNGGCPGALQEGEVGHAHHEQDRQKSFEHFGSPHGTATRSTSSRTLRATASKR